MKVLFVTTETNEIPKYAESLSSLGHQVIHIKFTHRVSINGSIDVDHDIRYNADNYRPDLIVYVGACGGNMPSIQLLKWLRDEIAPTVLICSDAADEPSPWWPLLREYEEADCFTVMVAIDGNKNWPMHGKKNGITALTPIDPARFSAGQRPHQYRDMYFAFAGNIGGNRPDRSGIVWGRRPMVDKMVRHGMLYRDRDQRADSYQEMCEFMCQTCVMPNFAETGSFSRFHVKGRVVEAGLAGCMLLETRGSPTRDWFSPGIDYLEYDTIEDVLNILTEFKNKPLATQAMGMRLREKVLASHTPKHFWGRVIEKAGVRA